MSATFSYAVRAGVNQSNTPGCLTPNNFCGKEGTRDGDGRTGIWTLYGDKSTTGMDVLLGQGGAESAFDQVKYWYRWACDGSGHDDQERKKNGNICERSCPFVTPDWPYAEDGPTVALYSKTGLTPQFGRGISTATPSNRLPGVWEDEWVPGQAGSFGGIRCTYPSDIVFGDRCGYKQKRVRIDGGGTECQFIEGPPNNKTNGSDIFRFKHSVICPVGQKLALANPDCSNYEEGCDTHCIDNTDLSSACSDLQLLDPDVVSIFKKVDTGLKNADGETLYDCRESTAAENLLLLRNPPHAKKVHADEDRNDGWLNSVPGEKNKILGYYCKNGFNDESCDQDNTPARGRVSPCSRVTGKGDATTLCREWWNGLEANDKANNGNAQSAAGGAICANNTFSLHFDGADENVVDIENNQITLSDQNSDNTPNELYYKLKTGMKVKYLVLDDENNEESKKIEGLNDGASYYVIKHVNDDSLTKGKISLATNLVNANKGEKINLERLGTGVHSFLLSPVDCACINRGLDPIYQVISKGLGSAIKPGCWWEPCKDYTKMLVPYDVKSEECPSQICQNIISVIDTEGNVNIDDIKDSINCDFDDPGNGECRNGIDFSNTGKGPCTPCTMCDLDTQTESRPCSQTQDRICTNNVGYCADGTYSEDGYDPCTPCTECKTGEEMQLTPCTPTQNRTCIAIPDPTPDPTPDPDNKNKNKNTKWIILFISIVVLILALYFIIPKLKKK